MYCIKCGSQLPKGAAFCAVCGEKTSDSDTVAVSVQHETKDVNKEALIRFAGKMVDEFVGVPVIPAGDISFEFINSVSSFNPLYILDDLKKQLIDILYEKTEYRYDESYFEDILEATYEKKIRFHQKRILETLIEDYKSIINSFRYSYDLYLDLRPDETRVFYYSHSIYYISNILKDVSGLFFARTCLKALEIFQCEGNKTYYKVGGGFSSTGPMFDNKAFRDDYRLYKSMMEYIESKIISIGGGEGKKRLEETKKKEKRDKTKQEAKTTAAIFIKVIFMMAMVAAFVFMSLISSSSATEGWIPLASGIALWLLGLSFNVRFSNVIAVIGFGYCSCCGIYPRMFFDRSFGRSSICVGCCCYYRLRTYVQRRLSGRHRN